MGLSSRSETIHGVLISLNGVGILMLGEPGVGKTECALKLISQGAQLVSDDVVEIAGLDGYLTGSSPANLCGIVSSRIFGMLDVVQLFGKKSVLESSGIDLYVELSRRSGNAGLESRRTIRTILGIPLPGYSIDTLHGSDAAYLIELAARICRAPESIIPLEKVMGQRSGT